MIVSTTPSPVIGSVQPSRIFGAPVFVWCSIATITRRAHLTALAGAAAAATLPRGLFAQPPAAKPVPAEAGADIPADGIGQGIRHLSYSDVGGRPDTVQVMASRGHLYVGHMFADGFTVLDARDPRSLKAKKFVAAAPNTRTHHLQTAGDYLLLANGANIVRMQSYDNSRDYFENTLADSLTKKAPFQIGRAHV